MSDYTMRLPYTRFVRRVSSENKSLTQWKVSMKDTLEALKLATWLPSDVNPALVTMPVNTPLTFTQSHAYDAFKMASTVAASGKEVCHMGMSAYRFTIPAEANTNDKRAKSIAFTLGADKFNVKGLKVAAYFSDTATPPTDWAVCRAGNVATEDGTTDSVAHGVLPSLETTVSTATNKSGLYTLTLTQAQDYAYLYLIITNWDYEDYRVNREYYIEGSGMIDGPTVDVTFEAVSVTADVGASTNSGYKFTAVSNVMAELTSNGMTEANAIITVQQRLPFFPGAYNTIADATADVKIGAYVATGFFGSISGAIHKVNIKTNRVPFKSLSFGSTFAIDLTSQDFSILCNLWVAVPIVATNDYVDFDSIDATNDASVFSQLGYGDGSLTLKVVKAGITTPTLSMVNVGQFFLEKGKAYTNLSSFPIDLDNTKGFILTGLLTMMPYEVVTVSTTSYVTTLLDCPIYLS